MNRYIIVAAQSCSVFFDEVATDPYEAIRAGETKVFADTTDLEPCKAGDPNSVYSVYLASGDFSQVSADDVELVREECEYVSTFREAA